MIESCSKKRMLTLIAALLICSLVILLFEEYVEDNEFESARIFRNSPFGLPSQEKLGEKSEKDGGAITSPTSNHTVTSTTQPSICDSGEQPTLTKACQPCSQFEISAVGSGHCVETGYFDEFHCEKSNKTFHQPCFAKSRVKTKFYSFGFGMFISSIGFGLFVKWRKEMIDQRVYTRIQNSIA
ncbi:jumping translocation breakpoint protein (JTB) domain-containing protein [Ditylenchus destructor]|nr:jumping translocation breakpoint protein (JTB) domain-containing protein [Ditylenchus destructor]